MEVYNVGKGGKTRFGIERAIKAGRAFRNLFSGFQTFPFQSGGPFISPNELFAEVQPVQIRQEVNGSDPAGGERP